jgi:hypothetical protein
MMHGITTSLLSIPTFVLFFHLYPVSVSHHPFRQRGHVVIPFVPGYDGIAGNVIQLGHITDQNLRPLDDLFLDHFLQGVLKNMKGAGEPTWDYEDALEVQNVYDG